MPLALRDLQRAFADYLGGDDQSGLAAQIRPAAPRLRIHRHNVLDSLAGTLAATFPTVAAVVGADFFRGLARAFIGRRLPEQPVLAEYGRDFPAFIAEYEPSRGLPYLADVARLDWALNLAFHAPVGERLASADLAVVPADKLPVLRLVLAAGTMPVDSPYPLDRIWRAAQPGASADAVDLASGGVHLLVLRRPDDAAFVLLSPGEAAFVGGIADGLTLEEAAERSAADFDLTVCFARLLGLGVFAALQQGCHFGTVFARGS